MGRKLLLLSRGFSWLPRVYHGKTRRSSREHMGSNDRLTRAAIVTDRPRSPATTLIRHLNRDTNGPIRGRSREFITTPDPRVLFCRDYDRIALPLRGRIREPSSGDLGDGSETLGHTYRQLTAKTPRNARQHTYQSSHAELRCWHPTLIDTGAVSFPSSMR